MPCHPIGNATLLMVYWGAGQLTSLFSLLFFLPPATSICSSCLFLFQLASHLLLLRRHYSVLSPPALIHFRRALRQLHSLAPLSISDNDQVYIYNMMMLLRMIDHPHFNYFVFKKILFFSF
jgi:hypothetical protein